MLEAIGSIEPPPDLPKASHAIMYLIAHEEHFNNLLLEIASLSSVNLLHWRVNVRSMPKACNRGLLPKSSLSSGYCDVFGFLCIPSHTKGTCNQFRDLQVSTQSRKEIYAISDLIDDILRSKTLENTAKSRCA